MSVSVGSARSFGDDALPTQLSKALRQPFVDLANALRGHREMSRGDQCPTMSA
jgi:hypothetical protein